MDSSLLLGAFIWAVTLSPQAVAETASSDSENRTFRLSGNVRMPDLQNDSQGQQLETEPRD